MSVESRRQVRARSSQSRATRVLWVLFALLCSFGGARQFKFLLWTSSAAARQQRHSSSKIHQPLAAPAATSRHRRHGALRVTLLCTSDCPDHSSPATLSSLQLHFPSIQVQQLPIIAGTAVSLDDPPIPVIGTDGKHKRRVTAADVAEFAGHVSAWRNAFHSDGDGDAVTLVASCGAVLTNEAARVLRGYASSNYGGSDGEGWDVVLLGGASGEAVLAGEDDARDASRADVRLYAVSSSGVSKLLTAAKAFTVPLHEWLSVLSDGVGGQGVVLRRVGAGRGGDDVVGCAMEAAFGESRMSDRLPFHEPVHWMHAAAAARRVQKRDGGGA